MHTSRITSINSANEVEDTFFIADARAAFQHGTELWVITNAKAGITVLDIDTHDLITVIKTGSHIGGNIVFSGSKAYITDTYTNSVYVIDTATHNITNTIQVGQNPIHVALTTDGKLYTTNYIDNTVSVIDTATEQVISTINVGQRPEGIASYGNTVYVTNLEDNTLSVISQGTVKTVNVGSHSYGVAVSPDGSKIYVTNWGTNTVSVLDSTTYRGLADIPVYNLPKEIILDGQNMYVKCMQSNDVSIIDVSQDVVTKTVPLLTSTNVPEFPSLILPVVAIIGLLFVVVRKKEVN